MVTLDKLVKSPSLERLEILKGQSLQRLSAIRDALRQRISLLQQGIRPVSSDESSTSSFAQRPDLMATDDYQQALRSRIEGFESFLREVNLLLSDQQEK